MLYDEKPKRKGKPAARHSRKLLIVCFVVAAFLAGMKVVYEAARQYNALLTLRAAATELMTIPGGTFTMGTTQAEILDAVSECVERDPGRCIVEDGESAIPAVEVTIDTFRMEKTEVTFEQYETFLNYLNSQGKTHLTGCMGLLCIQTIEEVAANAVFSYADNVYTAPPGIMDYPVYAVTWYGAASYCEALGRRLPTEAEWERTARGDDGRIYPWGSLFDANHAKTRIIPPVLLRGTETVGSYASGASPYGVLDMAGNVEEWVADWYVSDTYVVLAASEAPVVNPRGPITGIEKVLRGGHWDAPPFFARSVNRRSYFPLPDGNISYPRTIGFRCAADA